MQSRLVEETCKLNEIMCLKIYMLCTIDVNIIKHNFMNHDF